MNGSTPALSALALLALFSVLPVLAIAAVIYGSQRWEQGTRAIRLRLESARLQPSPTRYSASEIGGLPAPVQRYFRTALKDGQPIVTAAFFMQVGSMNMSTTAERWKPFTSTQRVITKRPGFDWDARIMMFPGVPACVHDAYVAGEGLLRVALFGLVPVVNMPNSPGLAHAELLRFFAEMVWYPTALLPSQGVRWESVDDVSACATLSDGAESAKLMFRFNPNGLIETVYAEARERVVDGNTVCAPWQGRFWNYAERAGMRVPLDGEVAWMLPECANTYWRGTTTSVNYEFAE